MSLSARFDTKDLFRYVIPGIVGFVVFLPNFEDFLPMWGTYSPNERIAFSAFLILALGLVVEIIVDLWARKIADFCEKRSTFQKILGLCNNDRTYSPHKLIVYLKMEDRNLIWHNTAISHMLAGTALILFISVVVNIIKIVLFIVKEGLSFFIVEEGWSFLTLIENFFYFHLILVVFGLFLTVITLKLAVEYDKIRQKYYIDLIEKYDRKLSKDTDYSKSNSLFETPD